VLKRTLIGLSVLIVLLAAVWWDSTRLPAPAVATAAIGALVMLGALDELLVIGAARPARRTFGRVLGLLWLGLALLAGLLPGQELLTTLGVLLTGASLLASALLALQIRQGPGPVVHRWAGSLWFQVPYVGGLACLVALLMGGALRYAVVVTLVAKSADIGAYFAGSFFGRRKMAPLVSPNKTWEGAVGGLLLPAVVAAFALTGSELAPARLLADGTVLPALVLPGGALLAGLHGVAIGLLSMISDLGESLLKRSRAVKDSGSVFGASGGFLDLADSLLLVGPCALAYTSLVS
jgi:phosphatidate cytidylyltransferase